MKIMKSVASLERLFSVGIFLTSKLGISDRHVRPGCKTYDAFEKECSFGLQGQARDFFERDSSRGREARGLSFGENDWKTNGAGGKRYR